MELLDKILENVRNGAVTNQLAKQQVLDLFVVICWALFTNLIK